MRYPRHMVEKSKNWRKMEHPKTEENGETGENNLLWRESEEGMITATPNNSQRIKWSHNEHPERRYLVTSSCHSYP